MAKKKKALLRLKPGNHQFIPRVHSLHNNDNTSSEELEWYLKRYPHLSALLEEPETDQPVQNEPTE